MVLFFFALVASCSSSNQVSVLQSMPEWYVTPQKNTAAYLYGVGMSYSVEDAKLNALNDAGSRLVTEVSSTQVSTTQASLNSYSEDVVKVIRANVGKMEFGDYEVSASGTDGRNFYAEVKIDRKKFVESYRKKLEDIMNQFNTQMNLANDKMSSFEVFLGMQGALHNIDTIRTVVAILKSSDDEFNDYYYSKTLSKAEADYKIVKSRVVFIVDKDSDVRQVISRAVKKLGFNISNQKSKSAVTINASAKYIPTNVYDNNIMKAVVDIKVVNSKDDVVKNYTVSESASSVISEDAAKIAVDQKLEKLIADGLV